VLEALGIVLAFVGFGLGWAALEARALRSDPPYPGAVVRNERRAPAHSPGPATWLVDGFNVLHAAVLHGRDRAEWWTAARRAEILELARRFDDAGVEIWVVFDGPRAGEAAHPDEVAPAPGGVHVRFAPSADDWLVERVRSTPDPSGLAVVTADRQVAGRVRHHGARVVTPREFLARCRP
jgi:predicted RNA-binding protein with PIN domain